MDRQRDGENAVADTAHSEADTARKESEAESPSKEAQLDKEPATLTRRLSRTLVVAASLSILVLGGAAAAAYALPSFNIALPNFSRFAELFSGASKPDPVLAALKDVQSRQQRTVAALLENGAALQRNSAVLQQSAATLESLRQDFTAQQTDLKRLSSQVSSLIARVDTLKNAIAPLTTSSIREPKTRAEATLRKRTLRLTKPVGPVSVGGAPLSSVPPPGWGSG
jgi:cell division protein FtsB